MSNIYAHTAPGPSYPEYISVNETDDPDRFAITVRSARKDDGSEGATVRVVLTMAEINELAGAIIRATTGQAV